MVFCFADQLGHGAHRAVDAPGAGLEQEHGHKAQHRGGEHHAVEAEGELDRPRVESAAVVGPVPGELEGPQQGDHLTQILGPGKDKISIPEHLEKHDKKEDQKAVAEGLALHPAGDILPPGQAKPAPYQPEELSPAAVAVAVPLGPADDGDEQGDKEAEQSQPGEQDVEEAQHQIGEGDDPQIVVPMFFHVPASFSSMTEAGHSFTHLPQPTHLPLSTWAQRPRNTLMAASGHTLAQQPQATHRERSTHALGRGFRLFSIQSTSNDDMDIIRPARRDDCDEITEAGQGSEQGSVPFADFM